MNTILDWIANNKEWLFSGAGVVLLSAIIGYFLNRSKTKKETDSGVSVNQKMGIGNTTVGSSKFENNKQTVNINPDKPKSRPKRK